MATFSSPKRTIAGSNPVFPANIKEKEMDREYTVEEVVSTQIIGAVLTYQFFNMGTKDMSDEEFDIAIAKWRDDATSGFLRYLDKFGFSIVRKEPALEKFPQF